MGDEIIVEQRIYRTYLTKDFEERIKIMDVKSMD